MQIEDFGNTDGQDNLLVHDWVRLNGIASSLEGTDYVARDDTTDSTGTVEVLFFEDCMIGFNCQSSVSLQIALYGATLKSSEVITLEGLSFVQYDAVEVRIVGKKIEVFVDGELRDAFKLDENFNSRTPYSLTISNLGAGISGLYRDNGRVEPIGSYAVEVQTPELKLTSGQLTVPVGDPLDHLRAGTSTITSNEAVIEIAVPDATDTWDVVGRTAQVAGKASQTYMRVMSNADNTRAAPLYLRNNCASFEIQGDTEVKFYG